ncbi:MAG: phenylalanine--tRNA ligase subunit alpha [Clostridia bacterium]|nr:phenylalanine--tRNA ligase subunit alpha [Clostridia bacterium]
MKQKLAEIVKQVEESVKSVTEAKDIEQLRVKYLGKKGELTLVLRGMGALTPEERPLIGKMANDVREKIEFLINDAFEKISENENIEKLKKEKIDVTMPGTKYTLGKKHPLTLVIEEIENVFLGLGYKIAEGPEVELDYYNFEALNIQEGHPARDEQDTFYISKEVVLRTQTSPVQIRVMEKSEPPIKIICPGRVYRSDAVDATHSPVFHQIEGLVVDKGITMADLRGTLEIFAKSMFGQDTKIRFRPHHFPFTEPSAEVDVSCWNCHGEGCKVCRGEGWVEILGAGMVHPKVLKNCGIDPEIYSGFAFGLGVERTAMGRFNIDDLRLLYENDVRFLNQF